MTDEMNELPINDEQDHEIIMHRDAHFSGDFAEMISYYQQEGKGMGREILFERIVELNEAQKGLDRDLGSILTEEKKELVRSAKAAYVQLKNAKRLIKDRNRAEMEQAVADLILSEEDDLDEKIEEVVSFGVEILPRLIAIIESEEYYSELFPGYGYAPAYAATCIGKIAEATQDITALEPLFSALGQREFDVEEELLFALRKMGAPAKAFLLKHLRSRPISKENEKAAIALVLGFEEGVEIAKACFDLLKEGGVTKRTGLVSYLILGCFGLESTADKKEFLALVQDKGYPANMGADIDAIRRKWKL